MLTHINYLKKTSQETLKLADFKKTNNRKRH